MPEQSSSSASAGMGCTSTLAVLLTVLFVGLKLTGHIAWSWWWVISPIPIAIVFDIVVFLLVIGGVFAVVAGVAVTKAALEERASRKEFGNDFTKLGLNEMKNVTPTKGKRRW